MITKREARILELMVQILRLQQPHEVAGAVVGPRYESGPYRRGRYANRVQPGNRSIDDVIEEARATVKRRAQRAGA